MPEEVKEEIVEEVEEKKKGVFGKSRMLFFQTLRNRQQSSQQWCVLLFLPGQVEY